MATTIAVLLLGALYVAVNMQLQSAQMSRDTIQGSTLERALMARMDADAAQVIGLSDPARYRFQAGLDTTESSATATPGSTTPAPSPTPSATNMTPVAVGATGLSSAVTSSSSDGSGVSNVVLPLGVMGDSRTLHLYISNLPREIFSSGASLAATGAGDVPPPVSDIRRVSYWIVGGSDSPGGMARQEVSLATSDDALQNLPPGIDDETSFIIADEVRDLNFQYWDGTQWQDSWDSTTLGPDGVTPIGSPLAVAVTVQIALPHSGPPQGEEPLRTFRHILAIPSANGMTLQTAATSGTGAQPTTSTSPNANSAMSGGGASP
jgi:hypothetical protein